MKTSLFAFAFLGLAASAGAHEVWIERDGTGPARIYLGEPAEIAPPGGDPEFKNLKAPRLVVPATSAPVRKAGHIEVAVPPGDVRAIDDNVFAPWTNAGKKEGVIYFARAGRTDTKSAMPFEIVPVTSGGNSFRLLRDGRPVGGIAMTLVSPEKWSRQLIADADGIVTVPIREPGRYLIAATQKETAETAIPGGPVDVIHRTTTTTFVASPPTTPPNPE